MKELPKIYEPQQVEGRIYQMWMDHDCFKAEPDPDKSRFPSSCRLRTSPASCTWAMQWTRPFRTS